jgi:transposase InsO family protein
MSTWPSTTTPGSPTWRCSPTDRRPDALAFLERALAWYRTQGITVEEVMTDNGPAYCSRAWRKRCAQLGLRHLRTRPYTPRTNGKAERFIQTLLRGWAYGFPYPTSAHRARALSGWLRWYNRRRPHSSLGGKPPISRVSHLRGHDS